jgi:serine-type D-Ala-D-Ala carboxypeptidase/endopeptidase (penicillin-binding protein 4)
VTTCYLRRIGVPMAGVSLTVGSGLTRRNRITGRAMARLLHKARKEPWFTTSYASFPVAGNRERMVGGTLRNRMNGTRAANNARGKTGTLTGVTALSGYVKGANGRKYVFSMLSNYAGSSPRPVENTFVVTLAGWR